MDVDDRGTPIYLAIIYKFLGLELDIREKLFSVIFQQIDDECYI